MIDSFSCTTMGINTNKNKIYIEIFCIRVNHFDFDVILRCFDVMLNDKVM